MRRFGGFESSRRAGPIPPGRFLDGDEFYGLGEWEKAAVHYEAALRLLGGESELVEWGPDGQRVENPWLKGYQFSLSGPIYAGTNEIQRNIVAERVLGLPRK